MDRKRFGEQQTLNVKHSLADEHLAALKQTISVQQPQGVQSPRAHVMSNMNGVQDVEFHALPSPQADMLATRLPDPLAGLFDEAAKPAESSASKDAADPFDV